MLRPVFVLFVVLWGAAGPWAAAQVVTTEPIVSDSAAVVTAAQRHVDTLAAPAMRGRGYGLDGHERAAAYLRRQFEQLGLEPVNGAYEQPFFIEVNVFPETPVLVVDGDTLRLGYDFLPMQASAAGAGEAQAVRVGAGLYLPEQGINDYAGKPVRGAVAVVDDAVPQAVRENEEVPQQAYAQPVRLQIAEAAGAEAAILLVDQLMYGFSAYDAAIPAFQVQASAWPDTASHVAYTVQHERGRRVETQNVMGRIPGTTRPDSTILVVAHYDHLGAIGPDVYFPGANDNASGVALLLELARYFTQHPPTYSVVFVAFSGEENGLLGSRYFAAHPPLDLQRVRFLLNFDMVASGEEGVVAVGGVDFTEAYDRLVALNDSLRLGPLGRRKNVPNSDHYFILEQGVPGFYLYTRGGTQPYHHVEDVPATLEWEDFWHVYRLARGFLEALGTAPATH